MRRFLTQFLVVALVTQLGFGYPTFTRAIDTSRVSFYNAATYNGLISDGDFVSVDSMSAADIQSFLSGKSSYLAQFSENGRSAAQIIYDAAHGYGEASGSLKGITISTSTGTISPRALLVTLQKEQSLVTLTESDRNANPDSYTNRLNRAMGYGCPDSGGCSDTYKGFTNQVEWAAWQLRYNYEIAGQSASWWNTNYPPTSSDCSSQYYVGKVCSLSNTVNSWDGWTPPSTTSINMGNKATAALYRYTPHVFNGNFNFWYYMVSWFGIGGATVSITSSNDTSTVSSRTYGSTIKIAGSKASDDGVYFNGQAVAGSGSTTWEVTFTPDIGAKDYFIEYRNTSGTVIGTKLASIERRHLGDINGDAKIGLEDLSLLGESYGVGVNDGDWRDLNGDSISDILDLSKLAEVWP